MTERGQPTGGRALRILRRAAIAAILGFAVYRLMIVPLLDPVSAEDISPDHDVVLFTTAWCTACDAARDYLVERGVSFAEFDIERSARGREHYEKIGGSGVPVALFGGERVDGFSRQAYARALERAGE